MRCIRNGNPKKLYDSLEEYEDDDNNDYDDDDDIPVVAIAVATAAAAATADTVEVEKKRIRVRRCVTNMVPDEVDGVCEDGFFETFEIYEDEMEDNDWLVNDD